MKSFLFSLKNPHNIAARRFAMTQSGNPLAIYCHADSGPTFGGGYDIHVCDGSNGPSYTYFSSSFANDTGKSAAEFFTGAKSFTVSEIEVFEITE
jgi:hypothetical protein